MFCDCGAQEEFARVLAAGDIDRAIQLATSSPGGSLRNSETIRQLQAVPVVEGTQSAVLKYFAALMEKGKLNKVCTVPCCAVLCCAVRE